MPGFNRSACASRLLISRAVPSPPSKIVTESPTTRRIIFRACEVNKEVVFPVAVAGRSAFNADHLHAVFGKREKNAVKRIRNTKPQKLLSDEERKNNLKKAFQAAEFIVKYKKILLVDDIYTTGSTVEAVACELMRCGVEQVFFLTLCTGEGIVR